MYNDTLILKKLKTKLINDNACYFLEIENKLLPLNECIGRNIKILFKGEINCIACSRKIKKSFHQGYCFPCFRSLAECDSCMIKSENCHYHEGTCRDSDWGEKNCFQDHFIYLANTGQLKVGITRMTNVPHRWIDQGASQALPILRVKERLHSGLLEVMIKKHMSDKTNWRTMLKGNFDLIDLEKKRNKLFIDIKDELQEFQNRYGNSSLRFYDGNIINIKYPIEEHPKKIISHNLDKNNIVSGKILGIRGQYLILDTGVFNVRKFSGYLCDLSII